MKLEIVILAAGLGKRMHSALPKVLHQVAGQSMLSHVIATAKALKPQKIVVVTGHQGELVQAEAERCAAGTTLCCCKQEQQRGTADAVKAALPALDSDSTVLVLYADTPLTPLTDLQQLLDALQTSQAQLMLLTCTLDDPTGYGRIVRNESGAIEGIVEQKDCSADELNIKEINSGIIALPCSVLQHYLPRIECNNAQHEYYLTDLTSLIVKDGGQVAAMTSDNFAYLRGVNSKVQLAQAERTYQQLQARKLLDEGVTLADPQRFDLRGTLEHGQDCFIDVNCVLSGHCVLGNNVTIGAGCIISDCMIDDNVVVSPYTVMEQSHLKADVTVGPFARLRPGNTLEEKAHVGNFVELKKAHLGKGTKAGHLSYLGDSEIGAEVNIGAGTITCNYDGANKHQTIIEDDVFVGSDTQLVAPVTVRKGATIAAGTTVTKEVPAEALVLTRTRALYKTHYQRPRKEKK